MLRLYVICIWIIHYQLVGMVLSEMLSVQQSKSKTLLHFTIIGTGAALLKYFMVDQVSIEFATAVNIVTATVPNVLYLRWKSKGQLYKILLFTALVFVIGTLTDIPTLLISEQLFGEAISMNFEDPRLFIVMLLSTSIFLFGCMVMLFFWKRYMQNVKIDVVDTLIFLLIPISQILYFVGRSHATNLEHLSPMSYIGVIICFVADIIILRMILGYAEKRAVEKQLQEMEYMWKLEKQKMEAYETKQQELSKIRHDFRNQIMVVRRLIEQNQIQGADKLLHSIHETIETERIEE